MGYEPLEPIRSSRCACLALPVPGTVCPSGRDAALKVCRRCVDGCGVAWDRQMLLAHHDPTERHRCARVGRRWICRRCLVLYPLLLAMMIATGAGLFGAVPVAGRNPLLWLLPLPAALEYTGEAFAVLRYAPRRQVVVTVLQACGGGAGFAWELLDAESVSFWQATLLYGCAAVAITAMGWRSQANRRARDRYQRLLAEAECRLDALS